MSMERICKKCGRSEGIRVGFSDPEEEAKFHAEDWCDCDIRKDMKLMNRKLNWIYKILEDHGLTEE